jgi:hypothetical protein
VRLTKLGFEAVLGERSLNPRNEIAEIRFVIDVLELAPSALRKVAAWRHLVMRTFDEGAIARDRIAGHSERYVQARRRDTVPASSNADDRVRH